MIINPINYTPAGTPVRARIMTAELRYGAPKGGMRSLPADIGTAKPSVRTRPPTRKEHPEGSSTSLPVLEPARAPVDVSSSD
jgi:hypothetical protein